jgi:xanthine dehydrogenase accessory factor
MTSSSYLPTPGDTAGSAKTSPGGQRALVLGCGDVGSAVAHQLFRAGVQVVLCDLPRSAHARRGMAFTDALFDGEATLAGVTARRVADCAEVRECWREGAAVALLTIPEAEVLAAMSFDLLVDATMRRNRPPGDIRQHAPLTIGVGPGFAPGENCHVAIESQWGAQLGAVLDDRRTAPLAGGPKPLAGVGRERFVPAPVDGVWRTRAALGGHVGTGDVVGMLEGLPIRAPLDGTLRGVTRDGVRVRAGQRIVEVDPRESPQVFGLGERPLAVATGVLRALATRSGA